MITKLRIYYLNLWSKANHSQHCCTTIALNLDEATCRAKGIYGPVHVTSSGTRILPHDSSELISGSGDFLASSHDSLVPPAIISALKLPNRRRAIEASVA